MIGAHKSHIDEAVEMIKEENVLLKGVDKQNSDITQYALKLDKIFLMRIAKINQVRDRLHRFYKDLKTEEMMSVMADEAREAEGLLDELPQDNNLYDD